MDIQADDLTERFIRGDSSRSTEGSGLGLSFENECRAKHLLNHISMFRLKSYLEPLRQHNSRCFKSGAPTLGATKTSKKSLRKDKKLQQL